jgi:hypothetical protein
MFRLFPALVFGASAQRVSPYGWGVTGLPDLQFGNDTNVVVEQPFGKHFGEQLFDDHVVSGAAHVAEPAAPALPSCAARFAALLASVAAADAFTSRR